MSILVAVLTALVIGVGLVLQQHAAEQAPKIYFLRLRLFVELLRKPLWLIGIVVAAAGQLMSVWVLGHLQLSLAEPLLATDLIFALILAVPLSAQALGKTELAGAVVLSLGVAGLSLARTVNSAGLRFGSFAYWPAAAGIAVLAWALALAGRRRRGQQRATLTGIAAGLLFGVSDALTRRTVQIMDTHHLTAVLTTWPGYGVVLASLAGLWLMESAFNAAALRASLPAITAAEAVTGIFLGVIVFGDVIRISPGMIALQAGAIVALVAGVIMVARADALSALRPEAWAHLASSPPLAGKTHRKPGPAADPPDESRGQEAPDAGPVSLDQLNELLDLAVAPEGEPGGQPGPTAEDPGGADQPVPG
jgi:drug/metabolite transporter (DMT)-like permease